MRASSRLVAYDNGYAEEFTVCTIRWWEVLTINHIKVGTQCTEIAESHIKGTTSAMYLLDKKFPGNLHYLFRRALLIIGSNSSFAEIACHMNITSRKDSETRDAVELQRFQVEAWFKNIKEH